MSEYQELFEAYVSEMREAIAKANEWWEGLVAAENEATLPLKERWPFGAVSHPFVIDCYRKWSLACEALNERLESAEDDEDDVDDDESDWGGESVEDAAEDLSGLEAPVEARELLVNMLPGRADDLADALSLFVFDPVGMDKDDRLV